ncbi:hypothetical protein BK022_03345 [Methylorubrum extorquens]|uniref:Uncharacterized protein n=1 Tax=Methylorubrum extorquens TaxID=408 RepID=A0A1S1P469_METEX|nr:hypothetical protein BK022_03345 [Methylorubrum extorquens]
MADFAQQKAQLPADVRSELEAATYFTLEACQDFGDHVLLASSRMPRRMATSRSTPAWLTAPTVA